MVPHSCIHDPSSVAPKNPCLSVKTRPSPTLSPAGSWRFRRRQDSTPRPTPAIAGGTGVVVAVPLVGSSRTLKACFSCVASHTRSPLTQDFNKLRAASDFATIPHSATQKCYRAMVGVNVVVHYESLCFKVLYAMIALLVFRSRKVQVLCCAAFVLPRV